MLRLLTHPLQHVPVQRMDSFTLEWPPHPTGTELRLIGRGEFDRRTVPGVGAEDEAPAREADGVVLDVVLLDDGKIEPLVYRPPGHLLREPALSVDARFS